MFEQIVLLLNCIKNTEFEERMLLYQKIKDYKLCEKMERSEELKDYLNLFKKNYDHLEGFIYSDNLKPIINEFKMLTLAQNVDMAEHYYTIYLDLSNFTHGGLESLIDYHIIINDKVFPTMGYHTEQISKVIALSYSFMSEVIKVIHAKNKTNLGEELLLKIR
jgi:hypothetical protein